MAEKKSYPTLPEAHWWGLRERFVQSIPGTVSESYLAATLNMKPESARANIIPALIAIGLIDEEGKTNIEMAKAWRDDSQYPSVCGDLLRKLYPQELLDSVPDPVTDKDAAERWFSHDTALGQGAVRKMVVFFTILSKADPNDGASGKKKTQEKAASPSRGSSTKVAYKATKHVLKESEEPDQNATRENNLGSLGVPPIHIDIQVHISSDASPDQIDKIFESMAKHIYGRDKV